MCVCGHIRHVHIMHMSSSALSLNMGSELDAAKTLYMLAAFTFASPAGVQDQYNASYQIAKRHNKLLIPADPMSLYSL